MDDYKFLEDIKRELDAEREVDYSVTPERGAYLMAHYPKDTPEVYKAIPFDEFFDGSLWSGGSAIAPAAIESLGDRRGPQRGP